MPFPLKPVALPDAGRPLPAGAGAAARLALAAALCLGLSVHGMAQQVAQQTTPQIDASFESIAAAAAEARDRGDIPGAVRLYGEAVGLNPQWQDGWWFLGVLQYGANQYGPAADALSHFLALKPNGGAALALRGLCEFETGQYEASLGDLEHGISLGAAAQPRNAEILLYHEALLLTRLGSFEKAIGKFTNFVKAGQGNPDLTTAIGLAGLRMPVLPQEADPAQAPLIAATGDAAAKVMGGDMDGGARAFEALFARYPETPNLHYLYGYLLFATQPDAAIAQFQAELAIAPRNAVAGAMLAWAYGLQGDFAAALPAAERAARQDPSLAIGQLMLGRALVETGDAAAGLPHLEQALQMEPGSLEAHLTLAKAYSKLGRRDDARRERLLCLQLSGEGAAPNANP